MALLLPLNELQGEVRGLLGRNVLKQQLQTGKMDIPSISSTLKETGEIDFSLEETDEANVKEAQTCGKEVSASSEVHKRSKVRASTVHPESELSIANITIHEHPEETYETSF